MEGRDRVSSADISFSQWLNVLGEIQVIKKSFYDYVKLFSLTNEK
jgi:hypothetical protein